MGTAFLCYDSSWPGQQKQQWPRDKLIKPPSAPPRPPRLSAGFSFEHDRIEDIEASAFECEPVTSGLTFERFFMEEEWRSVPGYEGRYEVSNLGRVRSFLFSRHGRIMSPDVASNGYVRVHLQFKKTWLVHRLVAQVFIPNARNLPVVNHKDGNPRNNVVANLEWSTHGDNMRHSWRKLQSYKNRIAVAPRGEASPSAKLSGSKVREIRTRYAAEKVGQRQLAKEYGVSKPAIQALLCRRTWSHVA